MINVINTRYYMSVFSTDVGSVVTMTSDLLQVECPSCHPANSVNALKK